MDTLMLHVKRSHYHGVGDIRLPTSSDLTHPDQLTRLGDANNLSYLKYERNANGENLSTPSSIHINAFSVEHGCKQMEKDIIPRCDDHIVIHQLNNMHSSHDQSTKSVAWMDTHEYGIS